MAMGVLFASVPVADLHAAVPWYEQLFGRPPDIVPNENEVMWRVSEDGWLYVIQDTERAGRTVVTISVSDLEKVIGELAGRGIRPGQIEAVGEAGRKSTTVDLDGNAISLIEVVSAP
jgi:glyoxylase I family protein